MLQENPQRTSGKNRALIAVAHSLLVTVYSFARVGTPIETVAQESPQRSLVQRFEKLEVTGSSSNPIALPPKITFREAGEHPNQPGTQANGSVAKRGQADLVG